jgi:hypothetical protein
MCAVDVVGGWEWRPGVAAYSDGREDRDPGCHSFL